MKNIKRLIVCLFLVIYNIVLLSGYTFAVGISDGINNFGENYATGDTSGLMLGIMGVLLGASLLAVVSVAVVSAKNKKK